MWLNSFNNLNENMCIDKLCFRNHFAFMEFFKFKGNSFYRMGNFNIFFYQVYKNSENRDICIACKSAHPRHTLKQYVFGEKKYITINTQVLNFLKIRDSFSLWMHNSGFSKNKLSWWFSEVKYSMQAKFLGNHRVELLVIFKVRK